MMLPSTSQIPLAAPQSQPRLLAIAAAIGLVAVPIAIITFFIRRRSASAIESEGTCGKCGYLVKGLTTFTCPECGSDLRQVGITHTHAGAGPPGARAPLLIALNSSAWGLVIWIASCLAVSAILTPLVRDYLWPYSFVGENVIRCYPKSRRYTSAFFYTKTEASAFGRSRAATAPARSRYGRFEMQDAGSTWLIGVNYLAGNHYYSNASGATVTHPGLPTAASVLDFLKINHIDTSDTQVQAEAAAAAAVMADAASKPNLDLRTPSPFPFDITSSAGSGGLISNGVPFEEAQSIFWPALLLTGILVIIRRRRRALIAAGVISTRTSSAPAPPPSDRPTRTLTILFSDIKDYTARAAAGSRHAVMDLVRRHRELAQPIARRHGGRIVKTIGDALLMTFESATDALLAGVEIQDQLDAQNKSASFSDAQKLELRIAVSTGEVIVEEGDVYGEPVNLASRLQQHAGPGEVLFSESTAALINRQEIRADDAGTFDLKGVPHPVRAYRASKANVIAPSTAHP